MTALKEQALIFCFKEIPIVLKTGRGAKSLARSSCYEWAVSLTTITYSKASTMLYLSASKCVEHTSECLYAFHMFLNHDTVCIHMIWARDNVHAAFYNSKIWRQMRLKPTSIEKLQRNKSPLTADKKEENLVIPPDKFTAFIERWYADDKHWGKSFRHDLWPFKTCLRPVRHQGMKKCL